MIDNEYKKQEDEQIKEQVMSEAAKSSGGASGESLPVVTKLLRNYKINPESEYEAITKPKEKETFMSDDEDIKFT